MGEHPYEPVGRKQPRSSFLVALAMLIVAAAGLSLMWSRGWLELDTANAAVGGASSATTELADEGAATATCERAAGRYVACVGTMLGPSMKQLAESKRDIESCAGDAKTVAMYEECLPRSECEAFLGCLTEYAAGTAP